MKTESLFLKKMLLVLFAILGITLCVSCSDDDDKEMVMTVAERLRLLLLVL